MLLHRLCHSEIASRGSLPLLFFLVCGIVFYRTDYVCGNKICTFNICTFQHDMCMNGGTCRQNEQCLVECDCTADFTGKQCETLRDRNGLCNSTCSPQTCSRNGICSQDPVTCNISCNCFRGYEGDTCDAIGPTNQTDDNPCFPLICVNGHCKSLNADKVMCKCDDEWTGDTCNIPCKKNCTQGKCVIFLGNETCQCPNGFTPESNCTEKKPKSEVDDGNNEMFSTPIIIFLFVLPVILLLISALLIYVIWRKRVIFVMKIIYYLQRYEDTDGKLYDAFISFRSSKNDEFWVLNTLFPKLENEMGFKICVHFRDFLVGETISNNIIDAIEKSRRTILVVSPDYVSGEWTRMEYQVAQQEMLNLRHKIIPIMYRDIDCINDVDKNLKLILNSITYIKWPDGKKHKEIEKFWEQLRLTMPKKHEVKSTIKGGDVINEWSADTKL